MEVKTSGCKRY